MPATLAIGFFVFGAVLVLIALVGGRFQIFSVIVSSATASFTVRLLAFFLGAIFLSLATYMGLSEVYAVSADAPPTADVPVVGSEPRSTPIVPPPTQTIPLPIPTNTPMPQKPGPTEFVLSYWQNVSDGRFESAWTQLSPGFRQAAHNNDYSDYLSGYQQMNLCHIDVSNVNLIYQDNNSAVVTAHFEYYIGASCNSSGYNFEMQLIFDKASNSWLLEKNSFK